MIIEKDTVVCFNYSLKNAQGDIVEQSEEGAPEVYLHGAGGILPALEQEFAGKQAGDKLEVSLQASQAYG